MPPKIDLTGKVFEHLTVLKEAEPHILQNGKPRTMWLCRCDCGEVKTVSTQSLIQRTTISCGHIGKIKREEAQHKKILEEVGKVYHECKIIEILPPRIQPNGSKKTRVKCICSCGAVFKTLLSSLKSGATTSCGCKRTNNRSSMEEECKKILNKENIIYYPQISFEDLRCKSRLLFDFGFYDDEENLLALLECQGIQHYYPENYRYHFCQMSDKIKKQYCEKKNIPLYEIKYDEDIEQSIYKILRNIYDNFVPSSDSEKV